MTNEFSPENLKPKPIMPPEPPKKAPQGMKTFTVCRRA